MKAFYFLTDEAVNLTITMGLGFLILADLVVIVKHLRRIFGGG